MDKNTSRSLAEGLVDALGFVAGGLFGGLVARWLGLDFMREGYGAGVIGGLLIVGLCAGLGVWFARRLARGGPGRG